VRGVREIVSASASALVVLRDTPIRGERLTCVACAGPIAEAATSLEPQLEAIARSAAQEIAPMPVPIEHEGATCHVLCGLCRSTVERQVALLAVRPADELFTPHDRTILESLACAVAEPVVAAADRLDAMLDHLNPRQRETLMHLCSGASEKEIANRIGRSRHTVHSYVKTIYRQLGVTSRAELVAMLIRAESPTELRPFADPARRKSPRTVVAD
jgi:DNA-binding CsgD family transcriptional regulator